ncbi:MAG TPA: ATP-grasp domain-containing protein, partial [Candidatus Angelobacter sp.]|nr:ATP-grasp domain-containing protein [Candidatus Angelobacter sp.]
GGGFLGQPLPASLAREGDMMLAALVKDVAEVGGIEIASVRDARLRALDLPAVVRVVRAREDPWAVWHEAIDGVDAVWPIAPETGGALKRVSELVLAAGRTLIGSRPRAVALAASKLATAESLAAHGIAVVPTVSAEMTLQDGPPVGQAGWVVKPDDGAGAESTRLFRRAAEMRQWLAAAPDRDNLVVQPYVEGAPASLSILCQHGRAWLLSCNRQEIAIEDGAFRFRGSIVGGLEQRRPLFEPIAAALAAAMPDLWGYVGIDFIDRAAGPLVLDVNPRLTTSYVGLGRAIGMNLAALVLGLIDRDLEAIERPLRVGAERVDVMALHA